MRELRVKLPELMQQRKIGRRQLAAVTGLRYSTLSDAYHGKRQPTLDTLQSIMNGIEVLSGEPVELSDVLEAVELPPADSLLEGSVADLSAALSDLEADTPPGELRAWSAAFEQPA
jgi:transcriptional regulator with XRE-family HTH domain